MDRSTVIHACKESEQTLTLNPSLERPGMLLGTEIVVYMRHIEKFKKWLFVDKVLAHYGSHEGSGTVRHEKSGDLTELVTGYNLARDQGAKPAPAPRPKILFIYQRYGPSGDDEKRRISAARDSWDFHFGTSDFIESSIGLRDLSRSSADIGDPAKIAFVRDMFDIGCRRAMPEDIVAYSNLDIGVTTPAYERLTEGVHRGRGVTVCQRRVCEPVPGRLYKSVLNGKVDGGFDIMAVTPAWWAANREKMPDMILGREAWDTVFRTIAEETADRRKLIPTLSITQAAWAASRAYTDDVAYHEPHMSFWQTTRFTNAGQKFNRAKAYDFFLARGDKFLCGMLDKKWEK